MKDGATAVRECALSLERVDTHTHLDCTVPALTPERLQPFAHFEGAPEQMDSRILAEGCRILYDVDMGPFARPGAPDVLFERAAALRAGGDAAAVTAALDRANIRTQLVFTGWVGGDERPYVELMPRVRYLAYINAVLSGHDMRPCPDFPLDDWPYYEKLCELLGPLASLDDYLDAIDAAVDGWRSRGVVGMKASIAYTTGLDVHDPTPDEARAAFARHGDMDEHDFRVVHDFGLRHALQACRRNGLPVVIHTGFQIWGHAPLAQSNPGLLHPLLVDKRYRDLTFVLLHGGNPYVGETTYLAGMFPNVVIDFTWISWMTRVRFRSALAEWLEVVPHDRICWGSDSNTPESIVGIDRIVRTEIARVLEDLIADKIMDEKTSLAFLQDAYLNTPRRVFGLE